MRIEFRSYDQDCRKSDAFVLLVMQPITVFRCIEKIKYENVLHQSATIDQILETKVIDPINLAQIGNHNIYYCIWI